MLIDNVLKISFTWIYKNTYSVTLQLYHLSRAVSLRLRAVSLRLRAVPGQSRAVSGQSQAVPGSN